MNFGEYGVTPVVLMKIGSTLYGTRTPGSDQDFKAVHLPSAKQILLQQVQESINVGSQVDSSVKNNAESVDYESYSLQTYLCLLTQGQTIALDMLFAPDDMILESSPLWEMIRENKHRLLSKKMTGFVEYCRSQAAKYGVKGSRMAAMKQAADFFTEAAKRYPRDTRVGFIVHQLPALEGEFIKLVQGRISNDDTLGWFFECCNRKAAFSATLQHAADMYTKAYSAYGKRAQAAMTSEGVDWKALSHAVRIAGEAVELLSTGNVTFPLPNADYVRSVKLGEVPYEVVQEQIDGSIGQLEGLLKSSILRDDPDSEWMDQLVMVEYSHIINFGGGI